MKKKFLGFITAMVIILSFMPAIQVNAGNYGSITEQGFVNKISSLKNTFIHGQFWNGYNGFEKTGTKQCPESNSTCPGNCSCQCGQFYYNNAWVAGQCHGYALKLGNLIFGGNPNTWTKVYNANTVYAGDIARINNDTHSIFIYKVDGNNIYYTDCNYTGPCKVNWNGYMTKSQLSSKLSWIYHLSGNTLTGTAASTPTATVPTVSSATVNDGTYTLKNASSGYMMNIYGGKDENGTSVTTWQYDGSVDQRIRVAHAGGGKYYLYAACSSGGRVVDVLRGANTTDTIDDGDKIDIYSKGDDPAQLFYIVPVGDGKYVFELASKDNYVIAASSASAAASNGTQLELKAYNGSAHQQWRFCSTSGGDVDASVKSKYHLDLNGLLDGASSGGIEGYGTCDVYINGSCVANDVADYYTQHTQGSKYEIKDIKASAGHTYNGVSSGSLSGTLNSNTNVVLKFTTSTYTITYNANGGTGAPSAQTKKHNAAVTLSNTTPTRSGYTFLGWATSADASTAQYQPGASFTANANTTLYAVWKAMYYLDLNGMLDGKYINNISSFGTCDIYINETREADDITDYNKATPQGGKYEIKDITALTGYTYKGVYSGDISGVFNENKSVILEFESNTYTVYFDANGGENSVSEKAVRYKHAYGELPEPKKDFHTFTGWYTQREGGTQIAADSVLTAASNQTLYAHWESYEPSCSVKADSDVYVVGDEIYFYMAYDEADHVKLLVGWDGTGDSYIIDVDGKEEYVYYVSKVGSYWARLELLFDSGEVFYSKPFYYTVKETEDSPEIDFFAADADYYMTGDNVLLEFECRYADEVKLAVYLNYDKIETVDVTGLSEYKYTPQAKGYYLMQLEAKNDSGVAVSRILSFEAEECKIDAFEAELEMLDDNVFDVRVTRLNNAVYSMDIITAIYDEDMRLLKTHIKHIDDSSISNVYQYTVNGHEDVCYAVVYVWESGTLEPLAYSYCW